MWSLWSACVRWTVANLWSEPLFIHTGSDAFQPADRPHCLYRYVVSMFGHPSCVSQDQLVQIAPFYLWSIHGTKVSGQCRFVLTQNLFHCLWLVREKDTGHNLFRKLSIILLCDSHFHFHIFNNSFSCHCCGDGWFHHHDGNFCQWKFPSHWHLCYCLTLIV